MPKCLNLREIKRSVDLNGSVATAKMVGELLESKQVRPDEFSLRDLFEATCGTEALRAIDNRKSGGFQMVELREANHAVDTSAFANITGQIIYNAIREAFTLNSLVSDQLVTTMQTTFLEGEKIAGIGGIGDLFESVGEGENPPELGLNEEYVEAPRTEKRAGTISVTREAVIADRTGLLLERCGESGKWMALNKEKRVLDVVLGVTNNYKRNGTSSSTYLTAGAYINDKTSNALVDWTDVEALELLFDAITDPNTGEPVMIQPDTLIVPTALVWTAERVLNATGLRFGDGASSTTATYAASPLTMGIRQRSIKLISNAYIKSRTSSATKWFYGRPKDAFRYSEVWKIEAKPLMMSADLQRREIVSAYHVSERGVAWAYEPRYMCRSDA